MPFEPGNTLHATRETFKGGRPKKSAIELLEEAREEVLKRLAKEAGGIFSHYKKLIREDAATCRHAIDKLLPDDKNNAQTINFSVNFVQFSPANNDSIPISATSVSTELLEGDASGSDASSPGMAPASGQRQDSVKFYNIEDVPGE